MNSPVRLALARSWNAPASDAPAPELAGDARFREAFRYSPIGMALVDLDGAWLALNDAVTRIVGYDRPYLLERGFQDITHPDDLEADLDNVRRLVAGEFPYYRMEKRYIHRAGHEVWVDLTVTLVRDSDGTPRYFVSQIADISERVRSEEARTRTRKLEGLVRVTGGLAHEFNNRFTAILPALEMIRMELGDGHPLASDVDLVLDEAASAAAVVERLSAFSARDTALVDRVCPSDTVHELVAELAGAFPDGIDVCTHTDEAAVVEASSTGLRQAVHALVDNAVEAMPGGGTITLRVEVLDGSGAASDSPLLRGPHVLITVGDEGEGMADAVRSKAFDPFFTTRGAAHRSGLGLTVVHAFASRAGGRAALVSTPGRGTEVRLHLPLAGEAGVDADGDADAGPAVSPTATPPSD